MWTRYALAAALVLPACARPPAAPAARPASLLLVTVDTIRADHVGAYGYAAAHTPSIDRLAREGVRFLSAGSPVPLTLPAHASILSGLLPPRHGLRNNGAGRFPDGVATLATALAAAGYRTGAFVGAFVLDHRFGLAAGFARYDDEISNRSREIAGLDAERSGREVADRALAWLREPDPRPFFAWVHFYDAHAPYEPPDPFATDFRDRPYDGEIAAVDAELGRLLAELETSGRAATTLVAVAGDHGEALGEHGELTHGLLLYEPSLHVPVVLRAPAILPAGGTVAAPVSLVDLAPTLAGLLGHPLLPAGAAPLDGRDLSGALAAGREPPSADVYAESRYATMFGWSPLACVRRGDLKYIAAPRPELYDLAADPGEVHDLLAADPARANPLVTSLASLASGATTAAPVTLDAEARAKLASLGYLGGEAPAPAGSGRQRDPKETVGLFRRFEEAHWALNAGRLDEARGTLERLVHADPANPVFVGQLAETSRRAGHLARAVELYRQAVRLSPGDRDTRYNLAVTLQEAGQAAEAEVALATAITLDPGRPEAHNALGIALSARGDLDGARDQFARAVQLDGRNARALNNLGNVLRDLRRFPEAEQAYRQAIAVAPDYPDPLNGLGTLEVQRDHPAAALPYFDRALALAPGLHEARLNRGIAAELAGQRSEAIAAYRAFLARSAGDPQFARQREAATRLLARLERTGPS